MIEERTHLLSPYKGLAAFEDTDLDALLFFGRGRDTQMIAANLMASRFTVLYGPLGVGKSSVLRAGVVRRLRSEASDSGVVVNDSWAGEPAAELVRAVAASLNVEPPDPDAPLSDSLAELTSRHGGDLYLVLDQFEELFVYPGAEIFAAALADVTRAPHLRVNVLLSLREDALAELDVFNGRIPNVFGNCLSLERLDRAAARDAVLGPLSRYNELSEPAIEIEPELVDAVLDDIEIGRLLLDGPLGVPTNGGAPRIEAPYLQLVMQALWDAERGAGSRLLQLETFDSLGRAEAIVRAHLDDAMETLPESDRDVAARIFNHLVTPSGTKIAHDIDDLAGYAGVSEEEMAPVVGALGEHRILRPVDGRWEIFHDVLADPVLAWRARHEADQALEREREEARRRHHRLLVLLIAAGIALAAMAAVTIYALAQRSNAREQAGLAQEEAERAQANALSAEAGVLIPVTPPETDPELGLLLAAEAARKQPTHRAADTLRRALLVSHLRTVLPDRRVTAGSFSPDGQRILVATHGGAVRLYSKDERRLASFRVGAPVTGASFSPDGGQIITTVRDGPATVWDANGERVASFGRAPSSASFGSGGSLVLTVDAGKAKIWKMSGALLAVLSAAAPVTEASFGQGDRFAVAFGEGPKAWVFEARSGRRVAAVNQHTPVTSAVLVAKREELVTTGGDGIARLWALSGATRLLRKMQDHSGEITGSAVARDGRVLVTTSTDTLTREWDLASGRLLSDLVGHNNRVNGVAFSRDGSSFVTWSADGTARVWDTERPAARVILAGHGESVTSASFDRSGERVLTTAADGKARVWVSHVDSELQPIATLPAPIVSAKFSRQGNVAAITDARGIEVLGVGGDRIASLSARGVQALAISGDGSFVAASDDSGVRRWRLPEPQPDETIDVLWAPTAVALDQRGKRIALGSANGEIQVWTQSDSRLATLVSAGPPVTSLAFSPTRERLAAGYANGGLEVWNIAAGGSLYRTEHTGSAVLSVDFDRTGDRLVSSGDDTEAHVWDAASGRLLYSLRGHASSVSDASFDPNGRWLVTAGRSLAGLWDRANRQRLLFLPGHAGRVLAASFDPTGLRIMTVGADGTYRSYACEVCAGIPGLLRLAEQRLETTGRELTPAERLRYLGG